jgi:phage-related protein
MRNYSTTITDELATQEFKPFRLLKMTISGTAYNYTDCDIPIYYNSESYSPLPFKFNPINYSMGEIVDRAEIEIDNLNQVMTSLFVGGTPQGSDVVLSFVVLDSNNHPLGGNAAILFQGEIDSWNLDEERLRIVVSSIFVKWRQNTLSNHSASCRWKVFKSTECDYVGASTWCDRTYTRCVALSNTTNFGGFRWLPSLMNQDIVWGRVPIKINYPSPLPTKSGPR